MQRLRVTQMQMNTDKFWDISCFSANILHTYYVMGNFMNNLLNSYQERTVFLGEIGIEAQNITNCLLKIAFFFSTGKSLCALLVLNPSKRFRKYKNIQQQHHLSWDFFSQWLVQNSQVLLTFSLSIFHQFVIEIRASACMWKEMLSECIFFRASFNILCWTFQVDL